MGEEFTAGWGVRIITGAVLLGTTIFLGMALGLLYTRLFVESGMGFDAIADALGGVMVGGGLGFVATMILLYLLPVRGQWIASGITALLAFIIFLGLRLTAPAPTTSEMPTREPDFQPFFRVTMRMTHTEEILSAVPETEQPIPFTEAEVFSGRPDIQTVGWGPDFAICLSEPSKEDLSALLPYVQAAAAAAGDELCRTPEEDLSIALSWNVDGERGGQTVETGCLVDYPEYVALANALHDLSTRLCTAE